MKRQLLVCIGLACSHVAIAAPDGLIVPLPSDVPNSTFLELEADTLQPYIQAQVVLTLSLFRRADTFDAAMSYPSLSDPDSGMDAVLIRLEGNDRRYRTEVNGDLYVVTERSYALFPERSGSLRVAPAVFEGHVVRGGNITFERQESNPITLAVQPIPDAFSGDKWIAARNLVLYQDYLPDTDEIAIGKPVSRSISVSAEGLSSGQLPDLVVPASLGLHVYRQAPKRTEQEFPGGLIANMQVEFSMLPVKEGEVEFPEITLPWWNTVTDQQEVARFAGRQVRSYRLDDVVSANGRGSGNPSLTENSEVDGDGNANANRSALKTGIGALLVVLTGILVYLLSRLVRRRTRQSTRKVPLRTLRHRAIRACHCNDTEAAAAAALRYLASSLCRAGRIRSLQAAAELVSPELRTELLRLAAAQYAPRHGPAWCGDGLSKALRRWRPEATANRADPLPPLHPLASAGSLSGS